MSISLEDIMANFELLEKDLIALRDKYRNKFGKNPPDMSDGRYWNLGPEADQIESALESGIPIAERDDPEGDAFRY
tara:strand:- start:189 stop:416 length:228 start_codon:yes stop_codon:yes gene_type:complete